MSMWNSSFEVGIEIIDQQHKGLFDSVEELATAVREKRSDEGVAECVAFLKGYVVEHFSTEERLMARHSYPGMANHKKRHEEFKADFIVLAKKIAAGEIDRVASVQVQREIFDWIVGHIMEEDKVLGKFLDAKGGN
jgi:hemerythrin